MNQQRRRPAHKTPPHGTPIPPNRRAGLFSAVVVIGIMACVLLTSLGVSAGGGYIAGQRDRNRYITQTVAADLDEQYAAAVSDVENGSYSLAAQRVQYILSIDPDYPGAGDLLLEVARQRNLANTPNPQPTPLPPAATEDIDELYAEAVALYEAQEWQGAITRLREVRALDPDYRTGEVLQQLYEAQRALGLLYIRGDRLQEGIVLLEEAAKIQPLDDLTAGELQYANLYLNGLNYWQLNWNLVIQNFAIIYEIAPTYRDVASRLLTAYERRAAELMALGEYCAAAESYADAAAIEAEQAEQSGEQPGDTLTEALEEAEDFCQNPPSITPTPGTEITGTPGTPTATPDGTVTPGATDTPNLGDGDATPGGPTVTPTLRPGEIP